MPNIITENSCAIIGTSVISTITRFSIRTVCVVFEKLKDKNQSEQQRKQAHQAISLFYEIKRSYTQISESVVNTPQDSLVIDNHTRVAENQTKTYKFQNCDKSTTKSNVANRSETSYQDDSSPNNVRNSS